MNISIEMTQLKRLGFDSVMPKVGEPVVVLNNDYGFSYFSLPKQSKAI